MSAQGGDTDIDLNLASKGAGNVTSVEDFTAAKKFLQAKAADVAAATSYVLGDGNLIDVTGTGTINHIQDSTWQSGSIITLQFDAAATVTHNASTPPATTSAVLLEGGIDFVAAAGDKLTLYYDLSGDVWRELARSARTNTLGFTMLDAQDIALNTTTGTKIGTATGQKLGLYNATPVVQGAALTAPETTLTFVDENTPDFALSSLTTTSAAGFATLDEAQAFVEVVVNMQLRIAELEARLDATTGIGLIA